MKNLGKILLVLFVSFVVVSFTSCGNNGSEGGYGTWWLAQSKMLWFWMAIAAQLFFCFTSASNSLLNKVLSILAYSAFSIFFFIAIWKFPHWWYTFVFYFPLSLAYYILKNVASKLPSVVGTISTLIASVCTIVMYVAFF